MMNFIYTLIKKYRELIIYCIIGCTGAAIDFVLYTILTRCSDMHYQLANFLSVSFGIINNFFLNYFFNFKTKDKMLARLMSFYSVGMFGWALSAFFLWLLVEQFGINSIAAKLATIIIVTVVQFCLNKFITFRKTNSNIDKEKINVR